MLRVPPKPFLHRVHFHAAVVFGNDDVEVLHARLPRRKVPPNTDARGAATLVEYGLCSRGLQSQRAVQRRRADPELHRNLTDALALALQGERLRHIDTDAGPTDPLALTPGALQSDLGALHEALAFLLRQPTEDRNQERTHWPAGVEEALLEGDHLYAEAVQFQHRLKIASQAPAEAVE